MLDRDEFIFQQLPTGQLKFIGDFEGLYQSQQDPWDQSCNENTSTDMYNYYQFSRANLVSVLGRHFGNKCVVGLEVGCGHGHVVNLLSTLGVCKHNWVGMDISSTAIEGAKALYPKHTFYVDDITNLGFKNVGITLGYDVVILGQILWYVLSPISKFFDTIQNCYDLLNSGGLLIISQAFLKNQQYGKDVAVGFEGTIHLCVNGVDAWFNLIEARYDDTERFIHNDGLIVLRKKG